MSSFNLVKIILAINLASLLLACNKGKEEKYFFRFKSDGVQQEYTYQDGIFGAMTESPSSNTYQFAVLSQLDSVSSVGFQIHINDFKKISTNTLYRSDDINPYNGSVGRYFLVFFYNLRTSPGNLAEHYRGLKDIQARITMYDDTGIRGTFSGTTVLYSDSTKKHIITDGEFFAKKR